MKAKERLKKVFKAREPGWPESPTRTPLRSARDSGRNDSAEPTSAGSYNPAEPTSANSYRLRNGGEHSVWIDPPEPWSAEPPAKSQRGMELSKRNPLFDAESDAEHAGLEPRHRRQGVKFDGEVTREENESGLIPSKQGPKGVPFSRHSSNPLQSSVFTDGSRLEDLWTSESAGGPSERHVTNPLFFEDERSDESLAAPPQNPRSTERDETGRAIGVESLHTARLLGQHRSSAPGALLEGMSPHGAVAGKGPSGDRGPGIGQGGAKELKVPYKRSSFSS
jgi:hypothetical protein